MKVEIENLNGHFKKLTIEVPAEAVAAHADDYFKRLQRDVELKGFRKGKAPLQLVREMYGDTARPRMTRELVEQHFTEALRTHSFAPVSAPEINVETFSELSGLKFTAKFENTPPVELKNYTEFKKEPFDAAIPAEEVSKTLGMIQQQMASYEALPAETPIEAGLFVKLDYEASEAGQPVEAATDKDAFLEVGNGTLTPDFEKNLMGMKAGDKKTFSVKFPAAEKPEEATPVSGKTLDFDATIQSVQKKVLPELTDEWAKKVGPFEGLEDLKKRVEADMKREKEQRFKAEQQDKALSWLIEKNPVDVSETMVNQQMEHLAIEAGVQLQQMGLSEEAIEERLKSWASEMTERASRQVKASLLLGAIADKENIKVSEEDIRQEIARMAARSRKTPQEVLKDLQDKSMLYGLVRQLTELKALDFVLEKAN